VSAALERILAAGGGFSCKPSGGLEAYLPVPPELKTALKRESYWSATQTYRIEGESFEDWAERAAEKTFEKLERLRSEAA